jgi:hypothetical protein
MFSMRACTYNVSSVCEQVFFRVRKQLPCLQNEGEVACFQSERAIPFSEWESCTLFPEWDSSTLFSDQESSTVFCACAQVPCFLCMLAVPCFQNARAGTLFSDWESMYTVFRVQNRYIVFRVKEQVQYFPRVWTGTMFFLVCVQVRLQWLRAGGCSPCMLKGILSILVSRCGKFNVCGQVQCVHFVWADTMTSVLRACTICSVRAIKYPMFSVWAGMMRFVLPAAPMFSMCTSEYKFARGMRVSAMFTVCRRYKCSQCVRTGTVFPEQASRYNISCVWAGTP